ncbi:hypothetical protein B1C78_03710 [Thioalkalivibrio denitrificans]|uniref:Uncharacterized protein n=1 Tax=Thioalkalivibrio denitrificans TaxID=108003 RepID=A0A1V3NQH3_9GAMM|nr:XrtA/PEP-CTERM system TPR-repeat protein PrsT [Thioalkalivibrio denitrificans]OOG27254.1 hypothetical protein B1C78_03710 [Thioalkalivibrio denitrificans]
MAERLNRHFKHTARGLLVAGLAIFSLTAGCGQTSMTEEQHLERGIEFREQGNLRASVIELKNALQKNPSSQEGRWQLGLTYLEMEDGTQAEDEILRARELGMDKERTSVALARARVLQGRYDEALADLGDGTEASDRVSVAQAHLVRGLALLGDGQGDAAVDSFKAALEQVPDLAEAMVGMAWASQMAGDSGLAHEWVQRALAEDPRSPEALRTLADLAVADGEPDRAEAAYGDAIRHARNPFELHFRRAMVRVQLDDLEGAERDLAAMRNMATNHPMTLHLSGFLHSRHGRYSDAQADFESVLSRSPDHQPSIYMLAAAHYAQEHWNQAENHLRRLLRDNPGSANAVILLARTHVRQERVGDAIRVLEQGMRAAGSPDPAMSELLSALYFEQGQTEQGLQVLETALTARPDEAALHEMRGMALMRTGDRDAGLAALRQASAVGERPGRAESAVILSHLQAREYQQALEAALQFRGRHPEDPESHNLLGAALLGLDRLDEAREAFGEAMRLDPGNASAAMNLGSMEMRLGRVDEARQAFEAIQRRDPGHPFSAQQLATLEMQAGEPAAAQRWLRRAVETHPQILEPALMLAHIQLTTGQPEEALKTLGNALEQHPERLQAYYAMADTLFAQRRLNDAIQVMQRAETVAPGSADVQFRLAELREFDGDLEAALDRLTRALELDPGHYRARARMTFLLAQRGDTDRAREHLEALQQHHPGRSNTLALQGWFALREGRVAEAVQAYRQALDQTPRRAWVLELAQAQQAAGDRRAAAQTLTEWLERLPEDVQVRHALATHQMALGDEAEAIASYERILARNEQDPVALNNLAWLLRESDNARALNLAERARAQSPENPGILDTLGVVIFYSGDLERSARILRQVAERSPDWPDVHYHLARTLHAQGDRAGARAALERALAIGTPFAERSQAEKLLRELDS